MGSFKSMIEMVPMVQRWPAANGGQVERLADSLIMANLGQDGSSNGFLSDGTDRSKTKMQNRVHTNHSVNNDCRQISQLTFEILRL